MTKKRLLMNSFVLDQKKDKNVIIVANEATIICIIKDPVPGSRYAYELLINKK